MGAACAAADTLGLDESLLNYIHQTADGHKSKDPIPQQCKNHVNRQPPASQNRDDGLLNLMGESRSEQHEYRSHWGYDCAKYWARIPVPNQEKESHQHPNKKRDAVKGSSQRKEPGENRAVQQGETVDCKSRNRGPKSNGGRAFLREHEKGQVSY